MKAAVIGDHDLLPLTAMTRALERRGVEIIRRDHYDWSRLPDVDLAVIWGLRAQGADIMAHYRRLCKQVVVMDHGYINRVHVLEDYPTGYMYIGLNGLGTLPSIYDGERAKALDYRLLPPRKGPIERALICGQVAWDASHRLSPSQLQETYNRMAAKLTEMGVKEIRYRGHPMAPEISPQIKEAGLVTLNEALDNTDLVVTINSNSGLDALMRGLPVMIMKKAHYQQCAYAFGTMPLWSVKPPETDVLQNLINRLSYAQYTASEIDAGVPLDLLAREGNLKWPN